MSYAEQQYGRDLRERLNSRRQQGKIRHLSLRSRSRSSENADREVLSQRSPQNRRNRRVRNDSSSSWPNEATGDNPATSDKSSSTTFKRETDPAILARRQKQLDYGKNTLCYQEYTKTVPRQKREPFHPRTPNKMRQTSRRRWDSAIKNWRIHLHYWNDPVKLAELRRRKDPDSDGSESESASVTCTPERRRAPDGQPARGSDETPDMKQEKYEPPVPAVKQEPYKADVLAVVKQEHLESDASAAKREPLMPGAAVEKRESACPVAVKQEPADSESADVEREPLKLEPGQIRNELTRPVKQEPVDDDDGCDPAFSWADDVEGLAEELADGPMV